MAESDMGKDVMGPGSGTNESYTQSKAGRKMPLGSTGSRKQPVDGA